MITLQNYYGRLANANDLKEVWEKSKLPEDVINNFEVIDSYVRHLHSSNYTLYKDSLIVDHFLKSNHTDNIVIQLNKQYLGIWLVTLYVSDRNEEDNDFLCKQEDLVEILSQY